MLFRALAPAGSCLRVVLRTVVGPTVANSISLCALGAIALGGKLLVETLSKQHANHRALMDRRRRVERPELNLLEEIGNPDISDYLVRLMEDGQEYRDPGSVPSICFCARFRSLRYYTSRANYRYWLAVVLNKYGMFDRTRGTAMSMNTFLVEKLTESGWRPTHISRFVPQVIGLAMLSESQNLPKLMVDENNPGLVGRLLGDNYQGWKD